MRQSLYHSLSLVFFSRVPPNWNSSLVFCLMWYRKFNFIPFFRLDKCRQVLKTHEPVYQAIWVDNIDFDEVLISPAMIQDHMPDTVLAALNKVSRWFCNVLCVCLSPKPLLICVCILCTFYYTIIHLFHTSSSCFLSLFLSLLLLLIIFIIDLLLFFVW